MRRALFLGLLGMMVLVSQVGAEVERDLSMDFLLSPAETLYHDDGTPESYEGTWDAMCERMPAPSSTPYPFDIIAVRWNAFDTSSFNFHIWDDDGAGGLPGTSLFSQVVNPPSSGWFEITISPPVTIADGFIYIGCLTQVGIGFDETDPDSNQAYWDYGLGWEPIWWTGPYGDFLIRAIIEPTPLQNDVGVVEIVVPDTLINPHEPLDPEAIVRNHGVLDQDSFPVLCTIDSAAVQIYADTESVFALAAGETTTVIFPTWTPGGPGNLYEVSICTDLTGDELPQNDCLGRSVRTILHDGGVDAILQPPDTVFIDLGYYPVATVHNYGNVPESLEVICAIDSYEDTFHVTGLAPAASLPCTFGVWQVPIADSTLYQMTVASLVIGDSNFTNDTLSKVIFAYNPHDVGVDSILSPPDSIDPDSAYSVTVLVTNFGEVTEDSFWVKCIVDDGYIDSLEVFGLDAATSDTLDFALWTPISPGPWTMCVYVLLPFDRNVVNDSLCVMIYEMVGVEESSRTPMPKVFALSQSRPNPFAAATTILYQIPAGEDVDVSLRVYDVSGKLVRTLVDKTECPGYRSVVWDGRDESGKTVAGGIYFYRLWAGRFTSTRKMVVIR